MLENAVRLGVASSKLRTKPRYPAWPVGYLTWPLRNEGQLGVTVSHSSVRPPVPPLSRVAPYVSVFLWILGRVTHPLLSRHIACACVAGRYIHAHTCITAFHRGEKSNNDGDDEKDPRRVCFHEECRDPEAFCANNKCENSYSRLQYERVPIFFQ